MIDKQTAVAKQLGQAKLPSFIQRLNIEMQRHIEDMTQRTNINRIPIKYATNMPAFWSCGYTSDV